MAPAARRQDAVGSLLKMYIAGNYLFSGRDLDEIFEARRQEMRQAIEAMGPEEVREADGDELLARFRMADPGMRLDKSYFVNERRLGPGDTEEFEAANLPAGDIAKFKAITIAIPIKGDASLFEGRPSIYNMNQPQADIVDGELHICFLLAEVEEGHLEQNFKQHIGLIERQLEVTQWQVMGFNADLPGDIQAALKKRKGKP